MEGAVALFSHDQFGTVLGARWIGLKVVEGRHFSIGPASLSLLSYDADQAEVPSWLFGTLPLAAGHGFPADNFGAANPDETLYHEGGHSGWRSAPG
jgi:broad specificity phosphatase PhoE